MERIFKSINEMYYSSLNELHKEGIFVDSIIDDSSIGTNFGERKRPFYEIKGYSFQLDNSKNRLIFSKARRLSMGFNIANFLWFISGSNSVSDIEFYNKKGKAFSKNGEYYEAAFGDRIFGARQLINNAIELLKRDKNSRRALIPLFFPQDLEELPRDTPCASSIQVMIRNDKVDFFLHMRSQSVIMVFPYDIFLFTMLHEYISLLLKLEMGTFHYYANSFHYYTEEQNYLENIINEDQIYGTTMNSMPASTINEIGEIIQFENLLKDKVRKGKSIDYNLIKPFSKYWQDLLLLLIEKIIIENDMDQTIEKSELSYLNNIYT